MRLEGQTKLGYFPTPEQTLKYLITWLRYAAADQIRVLDPCCGRAEAIQEIADGHAIAYGIELSDVRAQAAEDAIPHVLNTAYEYAVLTPETFSLLLLNPPYDGESTTGGGKRMEETFLCDLPTTEVLIPGGVLLYIIPNSRINDRIARHLAGWYTNLDCFKLPEDEYEVFKQVVIFATKKRDYATPDGDILKGVLAWQNGQQVLGWATQEMLDGPTGKMKKDRVPTLVPLPTLTTGHGEYIIPETPLKGKGGRAFRFQYSAVSDEDFLREANECARRLDATREWQDLIPPIAPLVIEPAMTPKKGHIAMQVTGGLLGTNRVTDSLGRTLLLKGNVDKVVVQKQGDFEEEIAWEDVEDDKEKLRKVELEERFRALLTTIDENGDLIIHADSADIAPLLEKYVGQLAEVVQARNVPQYDMKPEHWEWTVFEPLSRGRRLPGRNQTGLTDFQKHLAIALGRLCRRHGAGFINAEMGSGKAQPLYSKVLTPTGWVEIGSIRPGDSVIGSNGKPTRVLGVYPQGKQRVFRVTFTDRSWTHCAEEHLWTVQTPLNKWKGKPAKTLTLREIMDKGLAHANGNLQHFIPLTSPVYFEEKDLPLDPYLLGVLIGDGSLSGGNVAFTTADAEIVSELERLLPEGVHVFPNDKINFRITTGIKGGNVKPLNAVRIALSSLGLRGHRAETKFIPDIYKLGSVDQRVAMLQGLLDSDGHAQVNTSTIEYATVSNVLASDIAFLVQSLGGTVTQTLKLRPSYSHNGERRIGQPAYRLFLALPNPIQPFRLRRKLAGYKQRSKYHPSRAIKSVDFVNWDETVCIKVQAEDGLYLTDNCIVTHNTTVGLAIAEYLRSADERQHHLQTAYPTLVVGPGIVTGKENWPKEISEVVPGAEGRVVAIGARPLPKPAKIGTYLCEKFSLRLDGDEFEGKTATWVLNAIQRTAKKQKVSLTNVLIAALKESLERAEKYPPVRRKGAKKPNLLDGRIGGYHWLGLDVARDGNSDDDLRGKYSLAQFIAEYQAGILPTKSFAIVSYETAKLGSGRVSAMTTRRIRVYWIDEDEARHSAIREVCACPTCGAVVSKGYDEESGAPLNPVLPAHTDEFIGLKRRYCEAPAPRRLWDAEKGQHIVKTHDEEGNRYICGAPLFENSAVRRIPVAEYARKKAKGVFGLCLSDEIHKCKSKGTGVGQSLMSLVNAARYTIGLTGTLLNGYSTSIFWLLYRLCGEVRQSFRFNDERRWVEKFGLLRRTFYTDSEASVADDGAFTGTKYFETVSERPGISPAIAGLGLKYCTFSSLKDVGLPLPTYSEEIMRLTMTQSMQAQYAEADGSGSGPSGLFAWALRTQKEETGKGAISVWLNTALNRADAMFREESVFFNRRLFGRGRFAKRQRELVKTFDPVTEPGEWLPKELWTAERALAEYHGGRKTLVYVRQTGERDIQPRLQECLMAHGMRVGILRPSLAPEKRATWIKRHVNEFDVLLTNARLVEVGLNLVMFSTGIFFELEWSLAVVWQAMRRLYRPGAPKPVKLYFPVYRGTLEEAALDLIGAKMLAAQVFYGDQAGGALVDEGDEGNLLNDLVRRAMGELQVGRADGIFTLSDESDASELSVVAPLPVSNPPATTLADLWERRREFRQAKKPQHLPNLGESVNQMTLF